MRRGIEVICYFIRIDGIIIWLNLELGVFC